jgi:hypothetical protein
MVGIWRLSHKNDTSLLRNKFESQTFDKVSQQPHGSESEGWFALEKRDVYAFFILSGMTDRAKNFRERATKASSYNVDYFFKLVDQNPTNYLRK